MENLGFGDDKELVNYVLKNLSNENKEGITPEKIENVLDFMLDFFEYKGYMDDETDSNEEVIIDDDEMANFIQEKLEKNAISLTEAQVKEILDIEYQFNLNEGVYD
ncbi:MAG: hypothetical protein IJ916_05870 [Paludibacteraceae bacterium]|nr:hypothetical protein [Paludibacteraceae bacterium]MBR2261213.1 hypothetical protein [Paludibacteraceae bacterium]MEE3484773.1 hypothetical protein [Bacteroidales bacterium]